jgi:transcriptional regulator GlxA family with amidase domain
MASHTAPFDEREESRKIGLIAYNGVQTLDVVGPMETFATVRRNLPPARESSTIPYTIQVLSTSGGLVRSSSGLMLMTAPLPDPRGYLFDTVLVAGGTGVWDAARDTELLNWLQSVAPRVRRIGSLCSGTFVIAAAGLLDGLHATTHWRYFDKLEREFPRISVDRESLFVRDHNVVTSAGVIAAVDLALDMVESDISSSIALTVARDLMLYLKRSGGQAQFSAQLTGQFAGTPKIEQAIGWMAEHLAEDISVAEVAERSAMSERNFSRRFKEETGVAPREYLRLLRLDEARRLLSATTLPVDKVARTVGLGDGEQMSRVFRKYLSTSPSEFRSRFGFEKHMGRSYGHLPKEAGMDGRGNGAAKREAEPQAGAAA